MGNVRYWRDASRDWPHYVAMHNRRVQMDKQSGKDPDDLQHTSSKSEAVSNILLIIIVSRIPYMIRK